MTKIVMTLLVLLSQTTAQASLMFSPQEVTNIQAKRAQNHLHNKRNNEDCLECNGVLFQNETSWSAWLNGKKLTANCPQCRDKKIKIINVNRTRISLEWQHKGVHHLVTLKPNQHYDATLKKVISIQ